MWKHTSGLYVKKHGSSFGSQSVAACRLPSEPVMQGQQHVTCSKQASMHTLHSAHMGAHSLDVRMPRSCVLVACRGLQELSARLAAETARAAAAVTAADAAAALQAAAQRELAAAQAASKSVQTLQVGTAPGASGARHACCCACCVMVRCSCVRACGLQDGILCAGVELQDSMLRFTPRAWGLLGSMLWVAADCTPTNGSNCTAAASERHCNLPLTPRHLHDATATSAAVCLLVRGPRVTRRRTWRGRGLLQRLLARRRLVCVWRLTACARR